MRVPNRKRHRNGSVLRYCSAAHGDESDQNTTTSHGKRAERVAPA